MLILHDPDTLLHSSLEILGVKLISALESPARLKSILEAIKGSKHELHEVKCPAGLDLSRLTRNSHGSGYLQHLKNVHAEWVAADMIGPKDCVLPECFRLSTCSKPHPVPPKDPFARAGYYAFDMSSGISADSYKSIIASANLASEGAKLLCESGPSSGTPKDVFALCRPPGHHCDGHQAGGYCYVNNAAVAVNLWREYTSSRTRVAILDLDFHHGNGTQEIFYSDPDVLYVSIHGEDEYPYYTGSESEIGDAGTSAEGANLNLPLKSHSSAQEYLAKLDVALERVHRYEPAVLVVSLGFDTFRLDPLGSFKIDTEDYETIAHTTRYRLRNMPALILLEGGYVIEHLGANVLAFLKGWESA